MACTVSRVGREQGTWRQKGASPSSISVGALLAKKILKFGVDICVYFGAFLQAEGHRKFS